MYRCIKLKHIEPLKYLAITIATTIYWFLSFSLPPQTQPQNYTHWEGETRSEVQLLCHLKTWKTTIYLSFSGLRGAKASSQHLKGSGNPGQFSSPSQGNVQPFTSTHMVTYDAHVIFVSQGKSDNHFLHHETPKQTFPRLYFQQYLHTMKHVHTFLYCTYSRTS